VTSSGKNLNDFLKNQLTKFRAVYTVKVNSGTKRLSSVVTRLRRTHSGKKTEVTNP